MDVDIDFGDEKLNQIIKSIKAYYERFECCSMSVKTTDFTYTNEQEVTIKLEFCN